MKKILLVLLFIPAFIYGQDVPLTEKKITTESMENEDRKIKEKNDDTTNDALKNPLRAMLTARSLGFWGAFFAEKNPCKVSPILMVNSLARKNLHKQKKQILQRKNLHKQKKQSYQRKKLFRRIFKIGYSQSIKQIMKSQIL